MSINRTENTVRSHYTWGPRPVLHEYWSPFFAWWWWWWWDQDRDQKV